MWHPGRCVTVETPHISEDKLERYHMDRVREPEVSALEEHLIGCPFCVQRASLTAEYVEAMRRASRELESV